MRLEITASDRLGIVQDILDILVRQNISLRGVEIGGGFIYLNFPEIELNQFQHLMLSIRRIEGIKDVRTTHYMPCEREHCELETMLKTVPESVFSVDVRGHILTANDAALEKCVVSDKRIVEYNISQWVKGFNFLRWLESKNIEAVTQKVKFQQQDYLADLFPIWVPDTEKGQVLAGAFVMLKSEARLGEQLTAFRRIDNDSFKGFVTQSSAMRRVIREAKKLINVDAPMLIIGETGVGKELLARACHQASHRADKPFLVLNCASLPDNVAETELFGYGHGESAFESQIGTIKKGLFEQMDGGTLFLDEVGDMSEQLQVKLLRFLHDGSFRRVGEEQEIRVDIAIICSTQKDLSMLVQEKKFREDLFYRLNVLTLAMPALRERKADILPLAEYFVKRVSKQLGRIPPRITQSCQEHLNQYPWPGNVRQLENTLYRAVSLLEGSKLNQEILQLPAYACDFGHAEAEIQGTLEESVKGFESSLLRRMYPSYPSTRLLARKLGLSHTAIANKLREYGINKKTVKVL